MKLVDPQELIDKLSFENMADINDAVEEAVEAATPVLEGRLGTTFNKETLVDTFYVGEPGYMNGNDYRTEFRLTKGILSSVTGIIYAGSLDALTTDYTDILATATKDLDRGVIRDIRTNFYRNYVQVTYVAGFDVDDVDATLFNQAQVPAWLKQAAKLQASINLAGHAVLEQTQIKMDAPSLQGQLNAIINSKVRYTPMAMMPM